jgi:hypothetical protein
MSIAKAKMGSENGAGKAASGRRDWGPIFRFAHYAASG